MTLFTGGAAFLYALIFVGLIGLLGFYSALLEWDRGQSFSVASMGTLLVKQGFVAGLLVIAATNLLVISPRLRQARLRRGYQYEPCFTRFGKILILELTFAALLLASVSFLTYIPLGTPRFIHIPDRNNKS